MKLSTITGRFLSSERELNREHDGESFYIYTFNVEDGLDIGVQVSEYIAVPIDKPVKLTGHISTCKKFSEEKGRKAMFTYFDAKLIEPFGDNDVPSKRIECNGTIAHIYNMTVTRNGIEMITIVSREQHENAHTSIVHYVAMGKLARKLSSQIKVGDKVSGYGILRSKSGSFEVLLSELETEE